jgi:CheY-like chemotaxis protein
MQERQPSTESKAHPRLRVLIVDDSEDATEMLSLMLEQRGCDSARAHSGGEALEAYGSFSPDVVLLDLGLPDVDGFTVATRMLERDARPMLIALTGFGDDQTLESVRRCGFARHLLKPVDWSMLDKALAQARERA